MTLYGIIYTHTLIIIISSYLHLEKRQLLHQQLIISSHKTQQCILLSHRLPTQNELRIKVKRLTVQYLLLGRDKTKGKAVAIQEM